jgi:hypothetical protein
MTPATWRRPRARKLHPCPADHLPEAELDRRLWPLSPFAEHSPLYSPAMARLPPLTMVETGLLSFSIVCFLRFAGFLPLTVAAARVFHLIRLQRISPNGVFASYG